MSLLALNSLSSCKFLLSYNKYLSLNACINVSIKNALNRVSDSFYVAVVVAAVDFSSWLQLKVMTSNCESLLSEAQDTICKSSFGNSIFRRFICRIFYSNALVRIYLYLIDDILKCDMLYM